MDASEVAELLGLAHRNSVSLYQRRYPEMPTPVVERSNGRTKLWLRPEIERWRREHAASERRRKTDGDPLEQP
jgi:glutathione-regulated potassium-efflux system ancillary protein KefG